MGRAGDPGAAGDARVALPRDRAADHPLRAAAPARVPGRRDRGHDPGVRRRTLVGACAAQPDRVATESEAAVRAVGDRDERPVAAPGQGEGEDVMAISARIEYLQSSDLVDEPIPTRRRERLTLPRERQLTGLVTAAVGLPLLTLAVQAAGDRLSLEGQVLLY